MRMALLLLTLVALTAAELPIVPAERLAAITFDECRLDTGYVAPVRDPAALDPEASARFAAWLLRFEDWVSAQDSDAQSLTCALIDCAAMHDLARHEFEGEIAHATFNRLRAELSGAELLQCCARMVEGSDGCAVTIEAPELLGFPGAFPEDAVRIRARLYAKKLLGRLLGQLPE